MSDVAGVAETGGVVGTDADAASVAPADPQVTTSDSPQEKANPRDKVGFEMRAAERARDIVERMRESRDQAAADRQGQTRDPDTGRFVAQDETEKPEAAETQPTEPGAAEAAPTQDNVPEAEATPPKTQRVEIPQDHPIRQMGVDAITASSDQETRAIQALLNGTYTRRQENEQLQARLKEAEAKHNELMDRLVRADAESAAEVKFKQTPEYNQAAAEYRDMVELEAKGQLPPGRAQKYWDATVGTLFQQFRQAEIESRMGELSNERAEQAGREWVNDAVGRIAVRYPEEVRGLNGFDSWVESALVQFNALVEHGALTDVPQGDPNALHKAFEDYFQQQLQLKPAFQGIVRSWHESKQAAERARQAEAEKARAEQERKAAEARAVEEFKRQAADTRRVLPPNPVAAIQHGARTPTPTAVGNEPVAARSQFELQRQTNERAAQRAARYFNRGPTP